MFSQFFFCSSQRLRYPFCRSGSTIAFDLKSWVNCFRLEHMSYFTLPISVWNGSCWSASVKFDISDYIRIDLPVCFVLVLPHLCRSWLSRAIRGWLGVESQWPIYLLGGGVIVNPFHFRWSIGRQPDLSIFLCLGRWFAGVPRYSLCSELFSEE